MIKSLVNLFIVLGMLTLGVNAEETLVYKMFNAKSGELLGEQLITVTEQGKGLTIESSYFQFASPELTRKTRSELDENLETVLFEAHDKIENSKYLLKKSGNRLEVSGYFKGEPINLKFKLGKELFFHDPSVSLGKFALSGEKKIVFQVINPDDSKIYEMVAKRKGVKAIRIDNQMVEAIEIHWTVNDFRSVFFSQTYWFRKSDGTFLTHDEPFDNVRSVLKLAE